MEALETAEKITDLFSRVRRTRPLVHMLPNSVSASWCADALAAIGARPLMAVCPQEMEEIVSYADALVVNMGQPTQEKQEAARLALGTAGGRLCPVVLDPVGAGASSYRRKNLEELLRIPWQGVIKGNEAEIHTLFTGELTHEGIDSVQRHRGLWREKEACFDQRLYVVTGQEDRIFCRETGFLWKLAHKGQPAFPMVGTGCMTGAVLGALCAAARELLLPERERYVLAAKGALLALGMVQEQAAKARGYGAYRQLLLDGLSALEGQREFVAYVAAHLSEEGVEGREGR